METKFNFTPDRVAKASTTKVVKKTRYYDKKSPGFGLRVTPNGSAAYMAYFRVGTKPCETVIGDIKAWDLDEARIRARTIVNQADQGVDPRPAKKAMEARGVTLAGYWDDQYLPDRQNQVEKGEITEVVLKANVALFNRYLNPLTLPKKVQKMYEIRGASILGGLPLKEISLEDVTNLIRAIGTPCKKAKWRGSPYPANETAELINRIYGHALAYNKKRLGGVESPADPKQLRQLKVLFAVKARSRFLSDDEFVRFRKAVDLEPEPWRDYFLTLLLTGQRKMTVASMRWADLDLAGGTWTLRNSRKEGTRTKNGYDLTVTLSKEAVALLEERRRTAALGSRWVFPTSPTSQAHITSPQKAWARVCEAACLEDMNIHDLRRTMGTWMAMNGESTKTIMETLGHRSLGAVQRYMVTAGRERVEAALEKFSDRMAKAKSNVVPITDAKTRANGDSSRTTQSV